MTGTRIGAALVAAVLAAPVAAERVTPDGGGRIQSMEAQTMLIDGRRYDVAGAEVRLLDGGATGADSSDGPLGRRIGTVGSGRPIQALVPRGAKRAGYALHRDSDRRVRVIWVAAPDAQ